MRRLVAIIAMAGGVGLASGCEPGPSQDSQEEQPRQQERRFAEIQPRLERERGELREEKGPPQVEFSLWPGGSDLVASELMWLGSDEGLPLRDAPHEEAPITGEGHWEDGEFLDWSTSLVRVERPRPYEVDEAIELWGTPYDREFGELEAQDKLYELAQGAQVWLYQYEGDGMCYLLIGDEVVLSDCPGAEMSPVDEFEGDDEMGFKPLAEQWWVEVRSDEGSGWFVVRQAPVEVHSRKAEGFDELEGEREFERIPGELPDY